MSRFEEDDTFLSRWLNGELSPEELEAFEASDEGKEYAQMIQAADQLRVPAYDVNSELSKLKGRIAQEAESKPAKVIWMQPVFRYAVAASLLAIAVVSFLVLQSPLTKVRTEAGVQEIVVLPDGSEVKMNADSYLAFNEKTWEENREIELKGEAFFQVQKGSRFTVKTTLGDIAVLGTSFNVKARNERLEVECFTGKVNVSSSNANKDLLPGDAVRVENGRVTKEWKRPGNEIPDWLEGITVLDSVSVQVAIEELQRVFDLEIAPYNLPEGINYDGAFPNDNPTNAIKLVLETLNVRYSYDSVNGKLEIFGID